MIDDSYPLKIERLSIEDGGGFVAYALDLPGCISDGETEAEAWENGRAAVRDWLNEARRLGRRIPEPKEIRGQRAAFSDPPLERMETATSTAAHHNA